MPNIVKLVSRAFSFVTHDIWQLNVKILSKRKAFWIKQLKVLLITLREFNDGKVNVQAASLSFYLLMSIVPIAAFIFAVSSGFGIEGQLTVWLNETFPDRQDIVKQVLDLADAAISNARGGWVTGVGIVMLLWSSLNMFVRIEEALNAIWQSKRQRSWGRRFADYLSIMLVAPILLILSNSITVSFRYFLDSLTEIIPFAAKVTPFIFTTLPVLLIWILFTLLYVVMPNVKVRISPAFVSAVIAGTTFYLVEQFYLYSQVSISKYNAIYGSLAAIPLFLLCAKFGWQIVLFGAELTFAYQNMENYEHEILEHTSLSHRNFTVLSLFLLNNIAMTFKTGEKPKPLSRLADETGLSVRALNQIIKALLDAELILEVNTDHKDSAFMPSIDLSALTVEFILIRLENLGSKITPDKPRAEFDRICEFAEKLYNHAGKSGSLKITEL
ncbi:MAG: YihY/virulence factor BrkB family protein [Prevotellaceae bacterium]|jgi:membrane protein|nr:YihY/virulence factor BrkB family protein [Prevotellaceae bacterium]